MSYSSLPFTSKLFQLTALTISLTLAGCGGGGGDTVDSVAPAPDLGVEQPGTGGGEQATGEINIVEGALFNADGNVINSVSLEGAYYKIKVVDNTQNRSKNLTQT